MPPTFHRLLAAGIYYHIATYVVKILHPSQALLNHFREPQGNFIDVQAFLADACRRAGRGSAAGVLVTDFMKAFEFVNPQWILAVLRARRAPLWLYIYIYMFNTPSLVGLSLLRSAIEFYLGSLFSRVLTWAAQYPLCYFA
jgi:hypothetical protein